jgi:hypothetical protein
VRLWPILLTPLFSTATIRSASDANALETSRSPERDTLADVFIIEFIVFIATLDFSRITNPCAEAVEANADFDTTADG